MTIKTTVKHVIIRGSLFTDETIYLFEWRVGMSQNDLPTLHVVIWLGKHEKSQITQSFTTILIH